MPSSAFIAILSLLAVTNCSEEQNKSWYLTDQSKHDQLHELNSFLKYYVEYLNAEIDNFKILKIDDKETQVYIDAANVIQKLVKYSWLRNMKPDGRYSTVTTISEREKAVNELAEETKDLHKKTPVTDAILLFNKVDAVFLLNNKKETIWLNINSLTKSIKKANLDADFDKAKKLESWKSKLLNQLESVENDIKQAEIIREMMLQSYILIFDAQHESNNVKIKHSNGLEEDARYFNLPPLDTLTVLQEINKKFK